MSIINFFINSNFLSTFFYCVGVYVTILYLYDNLKSLVSIIIASVRSIFKNETLVEKYGSWAVVTGSTDGIGLEYARELARNGLNIVLISRSIEKLRNAASNIEEDFKVKTKCIAADFSKGLDLYEYIEHELGDIQVGILFNNVGTTYEIPEKFIEVPTETNWNILHINCGACTMLTQIIINRMLRQNGKGAIINISSGTSYFPAPYSAIYGASKAYITSFTRALQHELADTNITIQLLTPIFVVTKMIDYVNMLNNFSVNIPDAKTYVRSSVATIGKTNITTGYFPHAIQTAIMKLVPVELNMFIFKTVAKRCGQKYYYVKHNKGK